MSDDTIYLVSRLNRTIKETKGRIGKFKVYKFIIGPTYKNVQYMFVGVVCGTNWNRRDIILYGVVWMKRRPFPTTLSTLCI